MNLQTLLKHCMKQTFLYREKRKWHYIKSKNISGKVRIIYAKDKYSQFEKLLEALSLKLPENSRFFYWIDEQLFFYNEGSVFGNMPLNYSMFLNNSIHELIEINEMIGNKTALFNVRLLQAIEKFIIKSAEKIKKSGVSDAFQKAQQLEQMIWKKADGIIDALQRILFWNQLAHQTGHTLIGLGRLDLILDSIYKQASDEEKQDIRDILTDFIKTIHSHYYWKSCSLYGDTGQLIILGGITEEHEYFCNDFTYLFLDLMEQLNLPDPKILLRVSDCMPKELMEKACKLASKGTGSPLFSNDDIIIEKLISSGKYNRKDAYEYATSACWEPIIPGKSSDQNNVKCINYLLPLNEILLSDHEQIYSYTELQKKYEYKLRKLCRTLVSETQNISWTEDPLMTLLSNHCAETNTAFHKGGSYYNNLGFTSVGLANAVDSFLNIKNFIFEQKYSMVELREAIKNNQIEKLPYYQNLRNPSVFWGQENTRVIELANWMIKIAYDELTKEKNQYGGIYKLGLSSPAYIDEGSKVLASLDGRKQGDPLNVHISCNKALPYTEMISFASELNYDYAINGNVVDLMVTPSFIEKNFNKFVDFMLLSLKRGFFQLQMNVVHAATLIDAQKRPENHPHLIVRVWGFSAYFNELPLEYQNVLIQRALANERRIS